MNNTNDVQMPDSLIVAQAQNSLKQLLQAFPLPAYAWRLIIKDLMHEINDAYMAQLASDQEEYQRRVAEASAPEKEDEKQSVNN
nr:MAG TPA: hypothetical protein [Caudoviricetes sp.]